MDRSAFLQWLSQVPEHLFSQIAAQVLFRCENCTECCKGEGYAVVDDEDISRIARSLKISRSLASARFTMPDPGKNKLCRILKSTGPKEVCCFLDTTKGACRIYESRPGICRSFPMLITQNESDDAICFFGDCRGTASFARMILKMRLDPEVQRDIQRLSDHQERLEDLRVSLYVWLCRLLGRDKEADQICQVTDIQLSEKREFERDCIAYFLMTMKTDALQDYLDSISNDGE